MNFVLFISSYALPGHDVEANLYFHTSLKHWFSLDLS